MDCDYTKALKSYKQCQYYMSMSKLYERMEVPGFGGGGGKVSKVVSQLMFYLNSI